MTTERIVTHTVTEILAAHRSGRSTPDETLAQSFARIRAHGDPAVFITLRDVDRKDAEPVDRDVDECRPQRGLLRIGIEVLVFDLFRLHRQQHEVTFLPVPAFAVDH